MKNIIKDLRKEKGLTQMQLAIQLQIDQTTVSKWELGKAIPDTAMLITLSRFFDVSTDYLLGNSDFYYPDRLQSAQKNVGLSPDEQSILDDYRSLSRPERAQAAEYVHYLADRARKTKKQNA